MKKILNSRYKKWQNIVILELVESSLMKNILMEKVLIWKGLYPGALISIVNLNLHNNGGADDECIMQKNNSNDSKNSSWNRETLEW